MTVSRIEPRAYVLVYESTQDWKDGVVVGFADGHVELIKDRDYFQKLLEGSTVKP